MVAIDGKTLGGASEPSKKGPDKKAIVHMVSAWANTNSLVLGQRRVDEKSNEITAIPKLLDALELSGTVVTIDAMGCQQAIAEKIIDKKADYILAVKENQGHLLEEIEDPIRSAKTALFPNSAPACSGSTQPPNASGNLSAP